MKKFYRICVYLLIGLLVSLLSFSNASSKFKQDDRDMRKSMTVEKPRIYDDGETIDMEAIPQGIAQKTNRFAGILQFPERTDYATRLGYAIRLVQVTINWILGILAFVALIYMLYCGFLVFSSGTEDKNAQKGRKGISTAAIALAGIGLSWLIVSAMIWFINILTEPK